MCFCILQLNPRESEGVCVNCLSSFNKLQTRFPKEPGVGGLFVVQGEIRYTMTPYNHAFLIVAGFLCWEEIRFVIFTVGHEVAPLHLRLCI